MYNLVIVSMFKNESMILEEWINYYINQGVDYFYLINNGSTDNYQEIIYKYNDKITLISDSFRVKPNIANKLKTFDNKNNNYSSNDSLTHTHVLLPNRYFLEEVKNKSKWLIFIDCDEYIFIPKSTNISDFLTNLDNNKKYDKITDIFIPWKIFGSNNLDKQPESVIKGFNKRKNLYKYKKSVSNHQNVRGHGKSISRTKHLKLLGIHRCTFFTTHKTLMPDYSVIVNNNKHDLRNFVKNLNYNNNFIFCNHYCVMSKEYFNIKKGRSGGANQRNSNFYINYWKNNNDNSIIDNTLIDYNGNKEFIKNSINCWLNEMKDKIMISSLKNGGYYEPTIEKLEVNSYFYNSKMTFEKVKNNYELCSTFVTTSECESEKIFNKISFEISLANKEEGIYTIDGAPKKFIKCYNEKLNNNISYFLFYKFDSSIGKSEFDLSKMDNDIIEGYLLEKKLNLYMVLKLEYKTSYLLIIFLIVFFVILTVTIANLLK